MFQEKGSPIIILDAASEDDEWLNNALNDDDDVHDLNPTFNSPALLLGNQPSPDNHDDPGRGW